jgi:hypothetical protein
MGSQCHVTADLPRYPFRRRTDEFQSQSPSLEESQWEVGVKQPARVADHSRPSSAEVEKEWSHSSSTRYVYMM